MPWIKQDVCTGCGICVDQCPEDAIIMNSGGKAEIIQAKCTHCGICLTICPQDVIRPNSENPNLKGLGIGRNPEIGLDGGSRGQGAGRGQGMGSGIGKGRGLGRGGGRGR